MGALVTVDVPTAKGIARFFAFQADEPVATLALGHGAGGSGASPDLAVLSQDLPAQGITVVLIDQPWRVAGRKVAPAPPALDAAWIDVLTSEAFREVRAGRLIAGGRSAGARVACRTATACGADAVLALAFPLHPPGRPEKSRAGELQTGLPLLVVQGQRDPFGRPEEFPAGVKVVGVPADHSLKQAVAHLAAPVADFCR